MGGFSRISAQRVQTAGSWCGADNQLAHCSPQQAADMMLIAAYYFFLPSGYGHTASFPGKWSTAQGVPGYTSGRAVASLMLFMHLSFP